MAATNPIGLAMDVLSPISGSYSDLP